MQPIPVSNGLSFRFLLILQIFYAVGGFSCLRYLLVDEKAGLASK